MVVAPLATVTALLVVAVRPSAAWAWTASVCAPLLSVVVSSCLPVAVEHVRGDVLGPLHGAVDQEVDRADRRPARRGGPRHRAGERGAVGDAGGNGEETEVRRRRWRRWRRVLAVARSSPSPTGWSHGRCRRHGRPSPSACAVRPEATSCRSWPAGSPPNWYGAVWIRPLGRSVDQEFDSVRCPGRTTPSTSPGRTGSCGHPAVEPSTEDDTVSPDSVLEAELAPVSETASTETAINSSAKRECGFTR